MGAGSEESELASELGLASSSMGTVMLLDSLGSLHMVSGSWVWKLIALVIWSFLGLSWSTSSVMGLESISWVRKPRLKNGEGMMPLVCLARA